MAFLTCVFLSRGTSRLIHRPRNARLTLSAGGFYFPLAFYPSLTALRTSVSYCGNEVETLLECFITALNKHLSLWCRSTACFCIFIPFVASSASWDDGLSPSASKAERLAPWALVKSRGLFLFRSCFNHIFSTDNDSDTFAVLFRRAGAEACRADAWKQPCSFSGYWLSAASLRELLSQREKQARFRRRGPVPSNGFISGADMFYTARTAQLWIAAQIDFLLFFFFLSFFCLNMDFNNIVIIVDREVNYEPCLYFLKLYVVNKQHLEDSCVCVDL